MIDFRCGIYTITLPSGRYYVGSATNFVDRWAKHLRDLRRGSHHCIPLQRGYVKYGESALKFAKIAFVPRGDLLMREQEQIAAAVPRALLNACRVAGSRLGNRATPEALANMSSAKLRQTPETRAKISAAHIARGTKPSRLAIERGVAARLSKGVSEETRIKLSIAGTGRAMPDEVKARFRFERANKTNGRSKSGVPGVHRLVTGKWAARWHNGEERIYLGCFPTVERAAAAIQAAMAAKDK